MFPPKLAAMFPPKLAAMFPPNMFLQIRDPSEGLTTMLTLVGADLVVHLPDVSGEIAHSPSNHQVAVRAF